VPALFGDSQVALALAALPDACDARSKDVREVAERLDQDFARQTVRAAHDPDGDESGRLRAQS
jgi:hypothetical protein